AGLLAWIYEKLITWSNDYPWTPDEVLTWISIYYHSNLGPGASIYTYYEATHDAKFNFIAIQKYIDVPLAIAEFPGEVLMAPKSWRWGLGPIIEDVSGVFAEDFWGGWRG
ncbi:hypothetical protein BKA65DRAFT_387432, partial [Rhexocercosporidium sp. MPI-PUGE-AT-0058]